MRHLLVNLLVALNATQFADVTLLDKRCDSSFSKINLIDKKIKSISLIFDKCPDRVITSIMTKPKILQKISFHRICSKFLGLDYF